MNKTFACTFIKKLCLLSLITFFSAAHVIAQAPVISSFSPASGAVGTSVTITGTGFGATPAGNIVFFGATMATVTSASATSLTVTVPAGTTYEPISVLNGNTALIGYSAKPFVCTFSPSKGNITANDLMPPVTVSTGQTYNGIAIGDIDGDGKPDLVMANNATTFSVLLNTSSSGSITAASFAPKVDYGASLGLYQISVGDLDGDGKPDVVVCGESATSGIHIYRNTSTVGSISFAASVDFNDPYLPRDVVIADIDGDGKPEIAVADDQYNSVSIWRNLSAAGSITTSSFRFWTRLYIESTRFFLNSFHPSLAIDDLDGDGKPDIVVADALNNTVSVFRNNLTTGQSNSAQPFDPGVEFATANGVNYSVTDPIVVKIGDLDGDGKPDIITSNRTNASISILRNVSVSGIIASNSFAPKVTIPAPNPWDIAIGDMDGDGKPDLAIVNKDNSRVSVLRNTSVSGSITTTSFAPRVDFAAGSLPLFIAMGDLDGDGRADIAVTNASTPTVGMISVLRNNPLLPPGTQATNIIFTNTATNSTTATWSNGNGTGRAVFIAEASAGSPVPANSTSYAANAIYHSGKQIGTTGWYCVYNGTGNTVDISGLSSGATYQAMVVEYTGTPGSENYLTNTAAGNPASVTTLSGGPVTIDAINLVTSSQTSAASVQYTVTFASAVTGLTASNFALVTTGAVSGATISSLSGSGATYTVTVNTGTGDGTIGLNLVNTTGLSPAIVSTLPFAGQICTIDRAAPTITVSSPSVSKILSGAGQVTYTVNYADVNFNTSTLSASDITLNRTGSAAGSLSVLGSGTNYLITISGITGSGSLGISIAAGTGSDLAGNAAPAPVAPPTFLVAPTLSNLSVSVGSLTPAFSSTITAYHVPISNATSSLTVTPATTDPNAAITVNGGSQSTPINLALGYNYIPVNVTTLDGSITTTYTVAVYRPAPQIAPGKAPIIAYQPATVKVTGTIPFSISPTNTGGAVPKTLYGQVTTFVGSPTFGYVDSTGTAAEFSWPQDMVKDAAGNLYVTDSQNNAIRKVTPAGKVTTYAGSPTGEAGFIDGRDTSARFNWPNGITIDTLGNLYVSDLYNNSIRRISPAGEVSTLYGDPTVFYNQGPIFFDNSGNLIIAGQVSTTVAKVSPAGVATNIAGTPGYYGYVNGPAASAQFKNPCDVRMDASGNLIVADADNNAIRKISPAGVVSTLAGSTVPFNTGGYVNAADTAARFYYPIGVEIGPGGIIYICDLNNNDIRKIMPDGKVTLLAGSATQTPGDADGVGTAAQFNLPTYMRFLDTTGIAYISEEAGDRIRKIVMTGYTLNGTLPPGFAFDATTGVISGAANAPFAAQTDTITAYNAYGYSTTILTISYQPPSTIATLSNLVPSQGSLTPVFASGTTSYTDAVTYANSSISLTPTTADSTATVTVNGMAVASGTASPSIPLAVGPNTLTTVVTAQDGITTDTYTVIVTRAVLSTIATLSNLTISNGTLTPAFASTTTSYTASVPNSVTDISETPTFTDANATITVNGTPVVSGTASGNIPLAVGPNTITTVVTAQDGTTTHTYTVVVTRLPSSVATLADLIISQGTLSPAFDPATTGYAASVANSVTNIAETPTFTDANATITVNGTPVVSGTASGNIPLAVGPNTITTVVTAQDGTTTHTYTVAVTRAPSSVASLANLTISQGTLTPAFDPATSSYTASVSNSVTGITETPTFTDPNATITVNGNLVVSGTASGNIPLAVGPNTITTIVSAQDGTTSETYTVVITRAASSVATLANLSISQGTLSPVFDPATSAYTASVPNSVSGITETPTVSDVNASIKVNGKTVASGSASGNVPLAVGPNTITTLVTAQDGTTTNTYTVVVTRAASSVATLTDITVSEGKLTPSFSSGTMAYADSVSTDITSIKVTATLSDPTATILVNGRPVGSGTASDAIALAPGNNTITVMITAQDGATTDTYTIIVYRGKPLTNIDANNILTPNGDGKNDFWTIKDIGLYPKNNVNIFDKAGRLVYSKRGYSNDWDGTFNGAPLAEGTYYYVVDLGPDLPKFKGYISILRN